MGGNQQFWIIHENTYQMYTTTKQCSHNGSENFSLFNGIAGSTGGQEQNSAPGIQLNGIIIESLKTDPIHLMWSIQAHATRCNISASRNFFIFKIKLKNVEIVSDLSIFLFLKSDQRCTDGLRNAWFRFPLKTWKTQSVAVMLRTNNQSVC